MSDFVLEISADKIDVTSDVRPDLPWLDAQNGINFKITIIFHLHCNCI